MNKFLQYDSVDFAQEESFVRWIKENNPDDEAFWLEWIDSNPSKKEDIEKAKVLLTQIQFKQDQSNKEIENKIWSKIQTSISNNEEDKNVKPQTSTKTRVIRIASIAAVAAMAIFFLIVGTGSEYDTITKTQYAQSQFITLPDGSEVHLNADSNIEYNTEKWSENRTLKLNGEAFFKVEKGSQFMVETNQGNVTVLGTSFNIYQRNKDFKVYCKTGKVSVFAAKNTTILLPNEAVSIQKQLHKIEKNISPKDNRSNWMNGIYNYTNETIEQIAKELERQLDLKITLPTDLKEQRFTGSFSTADTETALSEVLWPLGMDYKQMDKNIIVTKKEDK